MRREISITSPDTYLATIQFRLDEMTNSNIDQEDSHEETLRYHTLAWVNAASSNGEKNSIHRTSFSGPVSESCNRASICPPAIVRITETIHN